MTPKLIPHPLACEKNIDLASTTRTRRLIIDQKPFLNQLYKEWYMSVLKDLGKNESGSVLELGSGGGFLKKYIIDCITSDILSIDNVDIVLDGMKLPFASGSFRAIVFFNVLHHIPDSVFLFNEAIRCLKSEGLIYAIEPWVTRWSNLIYSKLHYENFDLNQASWQFESYGPLSGANNALPWIIFHRDRAKFNAQFPELEIVKIEPIMPILYLLSGGVTSRWGMPGWSFNLCKSLEALLSPWMDKLAMFARIELIKKDVS